MTKILPACLLLSGLAAICASSAFAKDKTAILTVGQFRDNCRTMGGTMTYDEDKGYTCTLPNGTQVTCSFIGELASCSDGARMLPAQLDKLLTKMK